jgi:hypothetical protein
MGLIESTMALLHLKGAFLKVLFKRLNNLKGTLALKRRYAKVLIKNHALSFSYRAVK